MPIYEYKCNDCQFIFEKMKSIKDTSVPVCPLCESINTSKQLSTIQTKSDSPKSSCNTRSPFS